MGTLLKPKKQAKLVRITCKNVPNVSNHLINMQGIDKNRIPKHIAIIMDGNGRWARMRNLPRIAGHRKGAENITNIVRAANDIGVKFLTLYTFSVENWRRPQAEVNGLMDLFEEVLTQKLPELIGNNVRLNLIGNLEAIRTSTREKFTEAVRKTKNGTGLVLTIALNYSGRDDIKRAINKIIKKGEKQVSEEMINESLDTAGLPDPELLIRTSGEVRISNFLLWQIAYSEVYFSKTLWPDFHAEHLYEAIEDFQKRERRFGGL